MKQKLQQLIAQLQVDTRLLNQYFLSTIGIVAEAVGNGVTTAEEALTPFINFFTTLQTPSEGVKTSSVENMTMTPEYSFINQDEISTYLDFANNLSTKWTTRLTNLPDFSTVKTNIFGWNEQIAEFESDIRTAFFKNSRMFRAIVWYVESIKDPELIADGATWIQPWTTLVDELQAIVTEWETIKDSRVIRIQWLSVDFINPYTLDVLKNTIMNTITTDVNRVISERDGTQAPVSQATPSTIAKGTPNLTTADGDVIVTITEGKKEDGSASTTTLTATINGTGVVGTITGGTIPVTGAVDGDVITVTATSDNGLSVTGSPLQITLNIAA